jgi:threonine synthase
MDILVSSNLERLLYDLSGDPGMVAGWMHDLRERRRFAVDGETKARLQGLLTGDWVDDETCLRTIGAVHAEHGYLLDPHTAVAWETAARHGGDAPLLIVSTAHWSKFAADVVRGLSGVAPGGPLAGVDDAFALLDRVLELAPGVTMPPQMEAVRTRAVRFRGRVGPGREAVEQSLRDWLAGDA